MANLANMIAKVVVSYFGGSYIKDLNVKNIKSDSLFLEARYFSQKVLILVPNDTVAKSLIALFIYKQQDITFNVYENMELKKLPSFDRIFDFMSLKDIFKDGSNANSNILKMVFLKGIANFHSVGLQSYLEDKLDCFTFQIVDLSVAEFHSLCTLSIYNKHNQVVQYYFSSFAACSAFANLVNQHYLDINLNLAFNISNFFEGRSVEDVMIISL